MIVVRNVFRLKFGKARDALALWKEGRQIAEKTGSGGGMRAMTDLVGPFYTLVMEEQFESLAEMEKQFRPRWAPKSGRPGTRSSSRSWTAVIAKSSPSSSSADRPMSEARR